MLPPSGQYGNFSDSAGPVMLYGAIVDQQLKAGPLAVVFSSAVRAAGPAEYRITKHATQAVARARSWTHSFCPDFVLQLARVLLATQRQFLCSSVSACRFRRDQTHSRSSRVS